MLNYIWLFMMIIGIVVGIMNGRVEAITSAIIESAKLSVDLSIGLIGVICLWSGLMNIAEKSGLMTYVEKILNPMMRILFPEIPKRHPAMGAIIMNLAANFLGLGNAATPLGIKAMNELQKLNKYKEVASNSMSMFLVLNTSAIQLVPATIIAVRSAAGSANSAEIIGTIWISTICATISGVIAVKILSALRKDRR